MALSLREIGFPREHMPPFERIIKVLVINHRSHVTYMGAHMRKFDTTQMYKRLSSAKNLI